MKGQDPGELFTANPPGVFEVVKNKRVFIAGAGGLGSNVALIAVRIGIGSLIVADFDTVISSNLNRQQFFYDQIGMKKVHALADNMLRINPELKISCIEEKLRTENFSLYIPESVDVIFECFDDPTAKADLARFCLQKRSGIPLFSVSGIAGIGDIEDIKVSSGPGNIFIIGDRTSEINEESGVIASKVIVAAATQVHCAIKRMIEM